MANVSVYNMEGNEVGSMELNDAVFGVEVNEHLVHMVKKATPIASGYRNSLIKYLHLQNRSTLYKINDFGNITESQDRKSVV